MPLNFTFKNRWDGEIYLFFNNLKNRGVEAKVQGSREFHIFAIELLK